MGDVAQGLGLMRSELRWCVGSWASGRLTASISVGGLVLSRRSVVVLQIDRVCIP
jgi:hypothetical protein